MTAVVSPTGKVGNLVQQTGDMFGMGLEAMLLLVRPGFPLSEFVEQCWFIAKVTTLPVILISVPFGMVIALQVGSLLSQLSAQSQLGAVMVLAVVREQAPVAPALLLAGAGGAGTWAHLRGRRIRREGA